MRLVRSKKGFTLVELMVVMTIMSILAAIVVPGVTGSGTVARQTSESEDINNVQGAVDRFTIDDSDGSPWPTQVNLTGVSTAWDAGKLPTGVAPGSLLTSIGTPGEGTGTEAAPYIFDQNMLAGIDWVSAATVWGVDKKFYPDYARNKPRHATETITPAIAADGDSDTIAVQQKGNVVYMKLHNSSATDPVNFPKWAVDKTGTVWVFVGKDSY